MQLIRDPYHHLPKTPAVVATIGNFDGMHLGHQAVLKKLQQQSKTLKLPSMLIAFEPSAKEYFASQMKDQQSIPARLTSFHEKYALVKQQRIDHFACLRFSQTLCNMKAEDFVKNILLNSLHVKHLIVGDNFQFGKNRLGDFSLLKNLAKTHAYQVENTDSLLVDNERVSSSAIRKFLAAGDLKSAEKLLGRPYSMTGRVIHGDKKGRTINFPTANIPIKRKQAPINGVFAVEVNDENAATHFAVANIGHRPTVNGTRTQLEVHIFNFSETIYGQRLTVTFRKKLRDEKKFDSFAALKTQIENDAQQAKEYF